MSKKQSGEYVRIETLTPDPHNARLHNDRNLAATAKSLREFGQQKPIVVGPDGVVLAGNGTLAAALSLGWESIWIVRSELTGDEARAYAIADNRTAELAEWNFEELHSQLDELSKQAPALFDSAGFDAEAMTQVASHVRGLTTIDEDEVPEPPDEPITQPGDLWLLGEHRLLCGDSTNAGDVGYLMGRERAGLMNTDPPYGVGYANDDRPNPGVAKPRVAKPRVANDSLCDEQLQTFLESAFRVAVDSALEGNAAWYMWHAHLTQGYFAAAAAAANVVLHRQIIWVKPVLLLGRGHYHLKHEPCFMGWVKGQQPPDYGEGNGERTQTTVWEIASVAVDERREFNHSTPKPVKLFAIPIIKHLRLGEICFEPFAGSGPQFIAAEQLNRRCFGLEISPAYCDVIVNRWQKLTGKTATRESK